MPLVVVVVVDAVNSVPSEPVVPTGMGSALESAFSGLLLSATSVLLLGLLLGEGDNLLVFCDGDIFRVLGDRDDFLPLLGDRDDRLLGSLSFSVGNVASFIAASLVRDNA